MNYAVALSILSEPTVTGDTKILIGIRTPEANAVHQNVASVPTERIPRALFDAIAARASLHAPYTDRNARPGNEPTTYAVKSVLAQKLCVGHRLELGKISFIAAPRAVSRGITPILQDGDAAVEWTMAHIAVCFSGERFITEGTVSYSDITWMTVADFISKADDKEGFVFTDKRSHRIGGLCVSNTAAWLKEAIR